MLKHLLMTTFGGRDVKLTIERMILTTAADLEKKRALWEAEWPRLGGKKLTFSCRRP